MTETMSTDTTEYKHKCPFCDTKCSTEKKVRRHVSKSEDGDHRNINGFKMDRVIKAVKVENTDDGEMVQDIDEVDTLSLGVKSKDVDDKIVKAVDYVDELDNDGVKEIAQAADVPNQRVLRVLRDNGFDPTWLGSQGATTWAELSSNQKSILDYYYNNPDRREIKELYNDLDQEWATLEQTIERYAWLLIDDYRPEVLGSESKEGSWVTEGDTEDMLETFTKEVKPNTVDDDDTDESEHENDLINKLSSAGVEFEVEVEITEDSFSAVKKLINAGYDDLAEVIHEDEL